MKKLYNVSIALLALTSITFVFLDLCSVVSLSAAPYKQIDTAILLIFTIDYAVRFWLSKERKRFFKENIFDLIAIIPFNSLFSAFRAFRIFRLAKFTKLAKLSRMVRAAAFIGVVKKKISDILRTNGFIYVLYANIALIFLSSVIMMFAEKMSFTDSLWWSVVTCTTVGYGDISPVSAVGRVIAVILMIFGIGLIGMLTGAITTYFTSHINKAKSEMSGDELDSLIADLSDEEKQKLAQVIKIMFK